MDTIVIIASGPSLTRSDVALCEQAGYPLLGINNAYQMTDKLSIHYACEKKWWNKHYDFTPDCHKFSLEQTQFPDVKALQNDGIYGLSHEWPRIRTGQNGGYQAINLAYLFGYKTLILLGYDMQETNGQVHWHELHAGLNNPGRHNFIMWRNNFNLLAQELESVSIEILNATRQTALECFQCVTLEDVL